MKRYLAILVTLALLIGMVSVVTAEEKIDLVVFHYLAETTKQEGLVAIEDAYMALHPEVTFTNVYYNQATDYFTQLSTALSSGDKINIIEGNPGLYPDLVEEGFAMDLSDNAVIAGLNLPSGDLGDASANGVLYAFPIDFKTWGVFYNKTLFDELGLSVPTTVSELNAIQDKLAEAGYDTYARSHAVATYADIEMRNTVWTRALETGNNDVFEKLMSGEKKFVDYPFFKEGLEVWTARMKYTKPEDMSNTKEMGMEEFAAGKAAMRYDGTWGYGDIMKKEPQFEVGFFIAPIDEAGSQKMNVQVDQCFMVNPKADHSDVAVDFMEFWVSQGVAWAEVAKTPLLSGAVTETTPGILQTLSEIKKSGNIAHYGDFTMPLSSAFTTAWRVELTAYAESVIMGGDMTMDQCLENLQAAFDDIIALN